MRCGMVAKWTIKEQRVSVEDVGNCVRFSTTDFWGLDSSLAGLTGERMKCLYTSNGNGS